MAWKAYKTGKVKARSKSKRSAQAIANLIAYKAINGSEDDDDDQLRDEIDKSAEDAAIEALMQTTSNADDDDNDDDLDGRPPLAELNAIDQIEAARMNSGKKKDRGKAKR